MDIELVKFSNPQIYFCSEHTLFCCKKKKIHIVLFLINVLGKIEKQRERERERERENQQHTKSVECSAQPAGSTLHTYS